MAVAKTSNSAYQADQCLIEKIDVEQNFAKQTYVVFREKKFGITPCCYVDYESAVIDKAISDWKYSSASKVVISSGLAGLFIEPLAPINSEASILCPITPSNVCTVIDLQELLKNRETFIFSQLSPLMVWTITHNLSQYPSVTVVDLNNHIVVGDIVYTNSNILTITFENAFAGYAYLN
jgi:hypothetical protein